MFKIRQEKSEGVLQERSGLAGWLISRLKVGVHARERGKSRLALLDRISLAPRQSLALVEAEGRRFLIGTSPDGGPVFYALDGASAGSGSPASLARLTNTRASRTQTGLSTMASTPASTPASTRVSW